LTAPIGAIVHAGLQWLGRNATTAGGLASVPAE
jgi:hypothetical protein